MKISKYVHPVAPPEFKETVAMIVELADSFRGETAEEIETGCNESGIPSAAASVFTDYGRGKMPLREMVAKVLTVLYCEKGHTDADVWRWITEAEKSRPDN